MEPISLFSFSVFLFTLLSTSSQYTPPSHYFINCGSTSPTTYTGQTFVPDTNPASFSVSGGSTNISTTTTTTPLYQTSRIFNKNSFYQLQPDPNTTFFILRLHFFPDPKSPNSNFQVSVSGFTLLSKFQPKDLTIQEFIIPIDQSQTSFKLEFKPSQDSSVAFVNAIEAFAAPPDLLPVVSPSRVSPEGETGDSDYLRTSYAFTRVHMINVGGPNITVESDTLRRNWIPDDSFIFNRGPAKNATRYEGELNYQGGGATEFDAPGEVYRTAKQVNINATGPSILLNVTWSFGVDKECLYLVRAHFCDIVSDSFFDGSEAFNLFVYSQHKQKIPPTGTGPSYAYPFYVDFLVESLDLEFVNVSIGWISGNNQIPYLNGLEIMKLLNHSSTVEVKGKGKGNKRLFIVAGIGGVGVLLVLLIGFLIGFKCKRLKPVVMAESNITPSYGRDSYMSFNTDGTVNHPSPLPNMNLGLRVPFMDIMRATSGFDPSLMIGKGGFGKVYRGTLPNGMKVAVKRGELGHCQGRPEFVTEIMVLSRIRHRHLVSLIGYCDEKSEMILVYEFMEKGTLQDHLYNSNADHPKLSWKQRLEICLSAAQGLKYLHTGSNEGIIHRDVKSTNILLNERYVAKVADFGISRLDNVDQTDDPESSDIKGTFGYLDPEYIRCFKLTQKSDVYSFGVVLLEVLCARPALDNKLPQREANLADWAITWIKSGDVEKIVDPFLVGKINANSLRKFLDTVEKCLKDTGDERPSMMDVLWDLEYAFQLQVTGVVGGAAQDDTTMSTSLQLSLPLPSHIVIDDSEVNVEENKSSSHQSDSQVFSQLKIGEAR